MGPAPAQLHVGLVPHKSSSLLFCQDFLPLLPLGNMFWAGQICPVLVPASVPSQGFPHASLSYFKFSRSFQFPFFQSSVDCFCSQWEAFPKSSMIKDSREGWLLDGWEVGLSRDSVRAFQLRKCRAALNNATFLHESIPP